MSDQTSPERNRVIEKQFDEQLVRLTLVFAADVIVVTAVASLVPSEGAAGWSSLLIPLTTLAAFLPAALGSTALWIRRSRLALTAGTVAAASTACAICCDLMRLNRGQVAVAVVATFIGQIVIGLFAKKLAAHNVFPQPVRLATFALLFKLAIVGMLAAAFVPAERNPLRITGWITPLDGTSTQVAE